MSGLRPFFAYYGGKWRRARGYPPPLHRTVVEPFAGSAGYALRYPDRDVVLVDARRQVAELWDWLINTATPQDILSLPLVPPGTTTDDFGLTGPARYLVGYNLNPGCTPARQRSSFGDPRKRWTAAARRRVAEQLPRIRHWRVVHGDYTQAAGLVTAPATWFIDPPYANQAGRAYRMTPLDYDALATWVRERPGQVVVCESATATWLPFRPIWRTAGVAGSSQEAVYVQYT